MAAAAEEDAGEEEEELEEEESGGAACARATADRTWLCVRKEAEDDDDDVDDGDEGGDKDYTTVLGRGGQRFLEEEDQRLLEMRADGEVWKAIGDVLGREASSVRKRHQLLCEEEVAFGPRGREQVLRKVLQLRDAAKAAVVRDSLTGPDASDPACSQKAEVQGKKTSLLEMASPPSFLFLQVTKNLSPQYMATPLPALFFW